MGIDVGERRLGISMSDPGGVVAGSPSVIEVRSQKEALERIAKIVDEEGIEEIVVGHPVTLRGTAGPQADKASQFAALLSQSCRVSVSLWDERYTTVEAERLLRGESKRIRRKKATRDAIAAMLILQSYLDRKTFDTRLPEP
jgi:putative Holliday junction resolvase